MSDTPLRSPPPRNMAAAAIRSRGPAYRIAGRGQSLGGVLVATAVALWGCDPVFDLEGAFFPAWMLCMLVGIVLAVLLRVVFVRSGLEPHLGPLPLVYSALALLLTLSTWLLFFSV